MTRALQESVRHLVPDDLDEGSRAVVLEWIGRTADKVADETAAIPKESVRIQSAGLFFTRRWERARQVVRLLQKEGLDSRTSLLSGILDII